VRIRVPKRKSATLRLQYQWNPKTDVYPPGPVSGLTVTGRGTEDVSLRWTNSQAPDLQGVAVRRKVGTVPPAGLDDGRVVETGRDGESAVDENLRQYTTYSYSVFMVDTAGNASAPVSVTVRTMGRASQVVAGLHHSCALLPDDVRTDPTAPAAGRVVCWGSNAFGQLGTGSTADADQSQPVDLPEVVQVSAGAEHTCARQRDGAVWCWGRNDQGQLGTGTTEGSPSPVRVDVAAALTVAAGGQHTCTVALSGALGCGGADDAGQSGTRIGDPVLSPPETPLLTNVSAVAAGWAHTCAVRSGALRCFGSNSDGQLGNGGFTDTAVPVAVAGLPRPVTRATAGVGHTCAVLTDDSLACWGANTYGQVGDGTAENRSAPAVVLTGVEEATAGAYHTCARLGNATMRCWGRNNSGRLGDGTDADRQAPTRVAVASGVSSVAAGGYHSCAVSGPDTYCWGAGLFGQLGTPAQAEGLRPAPVSGL
jgi:alpha-tubulin suppressor-like RCC1 family protein